MAANNRRPGKTFEFMRPTVGRFQAPCYGIGDNSRNKNFVGLRLGHDARSCMDASDIPASDFKIPRLAPPRCRFTAYSHALS